MKKFEQIKEDISSNSDTFNKYQSDIEDKRVEVEALKVEVENQRNLKA
jgi:hypothetical protein